MNEKQKQAIADLKIKAANGLFRDRTNRLIEATPEAHKSVQNGTCDD